MSYTLMYVYMNAYVYTHTHTHTHVHIHTCTHTHTCTHVYTVRYTCSSSCSLSSSTLTVEDHPVLSCVFLLMPRKLAKKAKWEDCYTQMMFHLFIIAQEYIFAFHNHCTKID